MTDIGILGALAAIAVGMSLATAVMVKWAALAHTGLRAVVVLFLLLMMSGMLVGAAIYFVSPSTENLVVGLWVAAAVMSAAVVLVFAQFVRAARTEGYEDAAPEPAPLRYVRTFQVVVAATVIGNELLMGWTFQRAAGGPVFLGGGGAGELLANLVVSPWFVLPMAFEMACTLALLRSEFAKPMILLLAVQPVVMFASPPSIDSLAWQVTTVVLSTAAMAAAVAYLFLYLFRGMAVGGPVVRYATALYASFGLMAGGLAVWALSGDVWLFSVAVVCQMVIFLLAVVAPARYHFGAEEEPARIEPVDSSLAIVTSDPTPLVLAEGPQPRTR